MGPTKLFKRRILAAHAQQYQSVSGVRKPRRPIQCTTKLGRYSPESNRPQKPFVESGTPRSRRDFNDRPRLQTPFSSRERLCRCRPCRFVAAGFAVGEEDGQASRSISNRNSPPLPLLSHRNRRLRPNAPAIGRPHPSNYAPGAAATHGGVTGESQRVDVGSRRMSTSTPARKQP